MNPFKIGDKVVCVSSDGMEPLVIGDTYTINFTDWINECSVEEIEGWVHLTKRFELTQEQTK